MDWVPVFSTQWFGFSPAVFIASEQRSQSVWQPTAQVS
jgi:hypothetical protein